MRTSAGSTSRRMLGVYRFLLRLYPHSFRETFGDELCGVVAQSLREARERGPWVVWNTFFREIFDMAPNLLREYISNQSFNHLVERMLTHRRHSRWRQACALGFAFGFALMELANRLGHFFPTQPGTGVPPAVTFPGAAITISVLTQPDGSMAITPFHWVGLLMLAACGLIAGLVLNWIEKPASLLWLPLVTAACLCGSYAVLYGINAALWRLQIPSLFPYTLFNLIDPLLFGGLAAVGLGAYQHWNDHQPRSNQRSLLRIFFAGSGGIFIGGLAGWVIIIALSLVDWIERSVERIIYNQAALPDTGAISGSWIYPLLVGLFFSAAQGWWYGASIGEEIGGGQAAPVSASAVKPASDWLAKIVIALLVVIVMASLVMLAVNTAKSG